MSRGAPTSHTGRHDPHAKILAERDRLLSLWRSQGKTPAAIVHLYRAHVEEAMLRTVGGWEGFERILEKRRRRDSMNSPQSIMKRARTKLPQIRAQRRDKATGRFV